MATANLFPGLLKTPMGSSSSPQCRMCLFGRHWRMDTIGKQAEAHSPGLSWDVKMDTWKVVLSLCLSLLCFHSPARI